jgi:hypothetical protein
MTVVRGRLWLLALAAFLVRGGIVLLLPPLLVLPSPATLASLVSPTLVGNGLSNPAPALVTIVAATSLGLFLILVVTTVVGAWLDVAIVEATIADAEVARLHAEPEVEAPEPRPGPITLDAAIEARLVAHVPTGIALVLAVFVLRDAVMAELTSPAGSGSLVLRIVERAPFAVGAVAVAWFVGEAWGGLAVRQLATRSSVRSALGVALRDLVRPGTIATAIVSTAVVLVALAALWLSAGRAFERLWPVLVDGGDDVIVLIGLTLLVASWAAGLWLLAIGLAFRSIAWTAEVIRRR